MRQSSLRLFSLLNHHHQLLSTRARSPPPPTYRYTRASSSSRLPRSSSLPTAHRRTCEAASPAARCTCTARECPSPRSCWRRWSLALTRSYQAYWFDARPSALRSACRRFRAKKEPKRSTDWSSRTQESRSGNAIALDVTISTVSIPISPFWLWRCHVTVAWTVLRLNDSTMRNTKSLLAAFIWRRFAAAMSWFSCEWRNKSASFGDHKRIWWCDALQSSYRDAGSCSVEANQRTFDRPELLHVNPAKWEKKYPSPCRRPPQKMWKMAERCCMGRCCRADGDWAESASRYVALDLSSWVEDLQPGTAEDPNV